MKSSFLRNLHKAFLISVILLCLMAVLAFIAIRESHNRAAWVNHTEKVLEQLEHLLSQLKDAETGVRGYLITRDSSTLEPYKGSKERVFKSFNEVKSLTSDNIEQQEKLRTVENLIKRRFVLLQDQIKIRESGSPPDIRYFMAGKRTMDSLRVVIGQMKQKEDSLLVQRTESWALFRQLTPWLIFLITICGAVASYYFCSTLKKTYFRTVKLQKELHTQHQETKKRIEIIEALADKIAAGDYQIRVKEEESDVLGGLALSLNRMAISLEFSFNEITQLMGKKDDFIGIAAHELKTPLTSIKAYLQFISRVKLTGEEAAKVYPFVSKANSQVNRLTEIIRDLLDVARINENQLGLKIETFPLRQAILEVYEEVFSSVKTHEMLLEGDPDVVVEADKFRIEQVLINLVSNAVKYSPNSNKIILDVKQENDSVRVSVTDFGIGIPDHNMQFVFQRYYRVEVTSQNYSGMGLGLYITKGIIERHGGTIGVISREGEGSTFWFRIPVKQPGNTPKHELPAH